jgi:pimeloyl-ACP methyl ester carboxylesterase
MNPRPSTPAPARLPRRPAALLALLAVGCTPLPAPTAGPAADPRAELLRRGFRADAIAGPLGSLRFFRAGRGPLLVLIHGTGRQAGDWSAIAPALARRYTVVLPDLPGHGDSAPASGPLPIGDLAASLGALLDQRHPGRPAILVGNSLGGWVALLYALRHPERVERVVGISSSGIYAKLDVPLQPKDREQARVLWRAIHGPRAQDPSDGELDAIVTRIAAGPAPRVVAGLRIEDFLDAQASGLKTPVDLLWGEEDGVLPIAYGERLAALLPRARLHRLPGCAHMPQVDCPRETLAALRGILAASPR